MSLFQPARRRDPQTLVEEATLDFTMGDIPAALVKLREALADDPKFFPALHALAEIHFANRQFDQALEAAKAAHAVRPDDIHVNTSLSRIYMEKGDKPQAEHFGAQARMLSWKDELKSPSSNPPS